MPKIYVGPEPPDRNSNEWYDWNQKRIQAQYEAARATGGPARTRSRIADAFRGYMAKIYGGEGTGGFVKRQVQGVSDVMQPYMRAMSSKGAASMAGRGGLAGGAQATMQGQLTGQKVRALGQATVGAQRDVAQNVLGVGQLATQQELGLSQAEIQRFMAELAKRRLQMGYELGSRQRGGAFDWLFGIPPQSESVDWSEWK